MIKLINGYEWCESIPFIEFRLCMDQSIENIKNDQNGMVVKAVDPVTNACPSFSASSCDSSSRLLRVLQHDENLRVVGEWEGAWDTTSWRGQSSQPLVGGFIIFSPIQEVQVMVMNNANCLMFEKCSWVETLKPPLHPEDSRNSACCSQQHCQGAGPCVMSLILRKESNTNLIEPILIAFGYLLDSVSIAFVLYSWTFHIRKFLELLLCDPPFGKMTQKLPNKAERAEGAEVV